MNEHATYRRYQQLQQYVGWTDSDAERVRVAGGIVGPAVEQLIDDFYEEIQRHDETRRVITGGEHQVNQLKATLRVWLNDLFTAEYDSAYVVKRWRVGWRHVEIGLRQVYVNAAMARLRVGIMETIHRSWKGSLEELQETSIAINRALDLDLAIVQDAYEAEKKHRSETFFRNLIEAADCAIIIVSENDNVIYVNPYACKFSGYQSPELIGNSVREHVFQCEDPKTLSELFDKIKQEGVADRQRISISCRDKTTRQVIWNARKLREFEGAPAILLVGHDITEIAEAQERALQAERLAAIGQTVTGLAHESRNAFQRIQACLEMLALEVETQPEALELVSRIERAQRHLHHLYEEVRNYAAPIVLARQPCDIAQLVRDTWEQLDYLWHPKMLILKIDREADHLRAPVDPFALGQVFRNVLENAIAASPERRSIDVIVSNSHSGKIKVTIRDFGSGLTDAALQQVFVPFFTTKTRGTGLGMAIAKRIVDAHGGQIRAANHRNGGAIVELTILSEKGHNSLTGQSHERQ